MAGTGIHALLWRDALSPHLLLVVGDCVAQHIDN